MKQATKEYLVYLDSLAHRRKEEIRGTGDECKIVGAVYYVSAEGDDANDGRLRQATACAFAGETCSEAL